ncbi:MAG: F0F1 ATP synthase subunit C [Rhodospirillaceae bacterium]|jgi:ATP synthase F0 subunit c|nr:F0F1 ATP synthase subunit C [Rhodospirillaceae bacterium]MBT6117340.1 F0F1 ATP synthase subunit C [Rhodospirillaceae bacterium]MDA0702575.1 F0F1 ATP synthase subunit C [Pseudomonadota bacterium]
MEVEAAKLIGAGLAAIGVIGAGIGIGQVFSSFILAVGRNPAARNDVQTMTWIGFALVEAIALYALVIALLLLFAF